MIDEKKFNILRGIVMASYLSNEEKREMLGFLTELSEQPQAGWIPCEVDMPKEMEEVLISRENSKTGTSVGYYNNVFGWYDQCLLRGVTDVVAWMYKPQPYKKEGAE